MRRSTPYLRRHRADGKAAGKRSLQGFALGGFSFQLVESSVSYQKLPLAQNDLTLRALFMVYFKIMFFERRRIRWPLVI